ncbi:MAG: type II secretion system F family protein [Candidatus Aegiribacteria sp.]|nr:type II secretion system F family protein [Candidatus Aegiribacteria sp.]MBD3295097.1 type II secretion system F family protein [Candidatus Fermentibacteria bacterium]
MPEFRWEGTNRAGKKMSGKISAAKKSEAEDLLTQRGVNVTSIKGKGFDISTFGVIGSGVKDKELSTFTRQFAVMINAGLPLVKCLQILGEQHENKIFAEKIEDVTAFVEKGGTLADAMAQHENVFTDLYVNMVAAGEQGGILDTILNRLANHLEKSVALKSKIKSAMMYPVVVLIVVILVTMALLLFVIPIFQGMFADLGGELPGPTKFVVGISEFLQANILFVLLGMAGIIAAYKMYYKTDNGEKVIDTIKLKMPIFGILVRKMAIARFTRTLGTLISSGVSILDGLSITSKTSGNRVVADAIMEARSSISGGENISNPLEASGVFPGMVTSMIAVGEETGGIDTMLTKIADFYEEEVDTAVAGLTSTLEPIMIVILGGIVGGIVIAMYLPIFDLIGQVGAE